MQQENQFFRSLFDNAPFPYQSLDSEGRILSVNKAWQGELLYEKHEVLGRWFGDFVCSDQKETFRQRFAQFVREGSVQGVVWQLVRKDGSTLHVSFSGRIAQDENSRFLRTQCMFFDLSKRSEAEEQLRESEELRMAFMESAEEGFELLDADLRLIYINQGGARLFGAAPEELIGQKMAELSPGTEQKERYAQFQRVLETGEPFSIDEYTPPAQLGNRRLALSAFKVGDNLGIILRDVTYAKLSEQRLKDSEAKWRALTEESPDHVMILDTEFKIEYMNRASPGLTIDQVMGTPLYKYVASMQQDAVRLTLQTVVETGEPAIYETEYVHPEGKKISYESRVVPRVVNGEITGLIVSARDITDRKHDAKRTQQLLKRETAMASLAIAFGQATSLLEVYRAAYRQVKATMAADSFIISRLDAANALIYGAYLVSDGDEKDAAVLPSIALASDGKGIHSQVIRTGEPIIVANNLAATANSETPYYGSGDGPEVRRLNLQDKALDLSRSSLLVPIRIRSEIVGVMQVQSSEQDAYQTGDADLLVGLAEITAVAIENRELIGELQESYEGIIQAFAKAIELRDPYTKQHQEGVARLATRIGQILGLPQEQIRAIELAANIHDIGKVIIPAEILSKPSHLSGAQMSIVQSHVVSAHEVLEDIAFPWDIDDIVLQHHERLDGSGYPNELQGDAIRLEARILGVADIADAMMSHRPYRPAHSLEDTMNELLRLRGSALDTAVVDACIDVLRQSAALA
ncbi:PAS domain S-box protein [Candidatus Bipolaricaulota bacterium]|nr:PAS domain S-box protein [Candidatus Bipolaricaulota bacterium]